MELNNFMFEKWMLIDGYMNYYVSNFGRVINMTTKRILKPSISDGYKYVCLSNEGKAQKWRIHKIVALVFIDNPENKNCVDHKNNNRLDNNVSNLRWCSSQENNMNKSKRGNASSIYKGVHRQDGKWLAGIKYNNIKIHIGSFKTQEEAGRAYNEKASELFGEFAKLNVF